MFLIENISTFLFGGREERNKGKDEGKKGERAEGGRKEGGMEEGRERREGGRGGREGVKDSFKLDTCVLK